MKEFLLAERLAELRQSVTFPVSKCIKAYEVISDHMNSGVPKWHGLVYFQKNYPSVIEDGLHCTLSENIERLRGNVRATTHFQMAMLPAITTPVLLKIQDDIAHPRQTDITQYDLQTCSWNKFTNTSLANNFIRLHTCVLWPGFFSYKQISNVNCMSYVFIYKASSLVIGIWAFHVAVQDLSILNDFGHETIVPLLYPPILCLNSTLAERYSQSEKIRWELALIIQTISLGRQCTEIQLRKQMSNELRLIDSFALDIIEKNIDFPPDRTSSFRIIFNKILSSRANASLDEIVNTQSLAIAFIRECFVCWHLLNSQVFHNFRNGEDAFLLLKNVTNLIGKNINDLCTAKQLMDCSSFEFFNILTSILETISNQEKFSDIIGIALDILKKSLCMQCD